MTWSRKVTPAESLGLFLWDAQTGKHEDPPGEPTPAEWLGPGSRCQEPHPNLLVPDARERAFLAGEFEASEETLDLPPT